MMLGTTGKYALMRRYINRNSRISPFSTMSAPILLGLLPSVNSLSLISDSLRVTTMEIKKQYKLINMTGLVMQMVEMTLRPLLEKLCSNSIAKLLAVYMVFRELKAMIDMLSNCLRDCRFCYLCKHNKMLNEIIC